MKLGKSYYFDIAVHTFYQMLLIFYRDCGYIVCNLFKTLIEF